MDCNITNKEKRRGDVVNAKLANLATSQVRLRPKSFFGVKRQKNPTSKLTLGRRPAMLRKRRRGRETAA